MAPETWRESALAQARVLSRSDLRAAGVSHKETENRIRGERWQRLAPTVISTTTGELTDEQRMWLGVCHGGSGALVAGVHAAVRAGLESWDRPVITILTPYGEGPTRPLPGLRFIRTRRPLSALTSPLSGPPTCRVEPAVLLFASREPNPRTARGLLAACVQQQLTTPDRLARWLTALKPLRNAKVISSWLAELAGRAQSGAEMDVTAMCRTHGLALPERQVERRDADGLIRYTDCEWRLPDGTVVILEVDGLFHMDVERWEDDLARQRALSGPDRIIIRCTSREIREQPERIARDLRRLGVPAAA